MRRAAPRVALRLTLASNDVAGARSVEAGRQEEEPIIEQLFRATVDESAYSAREELLVRIRQSDRRTENVIISAFISVFFTFYIFHLFIFIPIF